MKASVVFKTRTGIADDEKVESYIAIAESLVRSYLGIEDEDASLDSFAVSVGDIAVLYYQRDKVSTSVVGSAGSVKSESFSEGGVSVSRSYVNGDDLYNYYDSAIQKVLNGLNGSQYSRKIKFC